MRVRFTSLVTPLPHGGASARQGTTVLTLRRLPPAISLAAAFPHRPPVSDLRG
jgi:hypothetical protein